MNAALQISAAFGVSKCEMCRAFLLCDGLRVISMILVFQLNQTESTSSTLTPLVRMQEGPNL